MAGTSIGITISYNNHTNEGTDMKTAGDANSGKNASKDDSKETRSSRHDFDKGSSKNDKSVVGDGGGSSIAGGGYYGALGGLMGKLIGAQNQNISG